MQAEHQRGKIMNQNLSTQTKTLHVHHERVTGMRRKKDELKVLVGCHYLLINYLNLLQKTKTNKQKKNFLQMYLWLASLWRFSMANSEVSHCKPEVKWRLKLWSWSSSKKPSNKMIEVLIFIHFIVNKCVVLVKTIEQFLHPVFDISHQVNENNVILTFVFMSMDSICFNICAFKH